MVLLLDGNTEHVAHASWRWIGLFGEKKNPIWHCSWSNQMPWTDQIRQIAPDACAPISELPYNISTMERIIKCQTVICKIYWHISFFLSYPY